MPYYVTNASHPSYNHAPDIHEALRLAKRIAPHAEGLTNLRDEDGKIVASYWKGIADNQPAGIAGWTCSLDRYAKDTKALAALCARQALGNPAVHMTKEVRRGFINSLRAIRGH